jgi:sugar/nucleoside kinase (ribokinase family)
MYYDFITIGGACEDLSIFTDEGVLVKNTKDVVRQKMLGFEYGAKIKVKKFLSTPGGGADNTAVALSRLGFRVAILAALGDDDRGRKIIKNLRKEGVDTGFVEVVKNEESGFSPGIVGRDNEHIFFPVRGANEKLHIHQIDQRRLKRAAWLYLTSLSGHWQPVLKKIFSVRGVKIAWNPGGSQIAAGIKTFAPFLARTEMLMVNESEARALVFSDPAYQRKTKSFFDNHRSLAKAISGWGPKLVVITMGEAGALAYDGKKFYRQPVVKAKRYINTIGVGDAFGSTFVGGLELFGGKIKPALKLAARNSSSVVEKYGAQTGLLTRKELL